jgi:hypothetical protein
MKTVQDALDQIAYLTEMPFNRFFYEKCLDQHIWTLYNINTFRGFEVHYWQNEDRWEYHIWKVEHPFIQDLTANRSTELKEIQHEENDNDCSDNCGPLVGGDCII